MSARSHEDLRAWQEAHRFKNQVYRLLKRASMQGDARLSGQLREAASAATSCIAEGFGRFDPLDNARFVRMARASIVECQNHLTDAVNRGLISEAVRIALYDISRFALEQIGGYLDYLQSPEAKRNAERIKRRRIARAARRRNENRNPQDIPETNRTESSSGEETRSRDGK